MEVFALVLLAGGIIGAKWDWVVAIVGLAAGVWQRIRMVFGWLYGLVVVTNEVEWEGVLPILAYVDKLGKITRKQRGRNLYRSSFYHIRPLDRTQRVMFVSRTRNDIVFFYKRRPIYYHYNPGDNDHCSFSYIRGTVDWQAFLWDVLKWEEEQKDQHRDSEERVTHSRFCINKLYGSGSDDRDDEDSRIIKNGKATISATLPEHDQWVPIHWTRDQLGESHKASSLELLSLRENLIETVEEARFWYDSEDWYKERGIPWKRNFGFEGDPGTGKTSLARGIAENLGLPLYSFDIASMDNREFNTYWDVALQNAPCMILLEDIDGVFEGRTNKSNRTDALTFDCLLQCIDGAKRPDGALVVITTNHIDKLDPALKRAGRMDRIVRFEPLDFEGRLKIALRIVTDPDVARRLAMEGQNDPASDFQERCFRVALAQRYKNAV